MDPGKVFGRGISFPPRVGADGRVAWSEGEDNVREGMRVTLLTNWGERLQLANFGGSLGAFLFEPNNVTTRHAIEERIVRTLGTWEPRIVVESVTVEEDPADPQSAIATITYKLVATQGRERVRLGVTLAT